MAIFFAFTLPYLIFRFDAKVNEGSGLAGSLRALRIIGLLLGSIGSNCIKVDGFVKSPTAVRHAHGPEQSRRAALHFIFRHCDVL